MKKFFILITFQLIAFCIFSQDKIHEASEAYTEGKYEQAVEIYEALLSEKGESAAIYYNLGNCYYRLNKTPLAILNYERAHLLSPGDDDININLEMARLKATDRIASVDTFFMTRWIEALRDLGSTNEWSYWAIFSFLFFITSLFMFFFGRRLILKKVGFYAGLFFLAFCILSNIFAYQQKNKLIDRTYAIVFTPTVALKSSPDKSGTDLFVLHEGAKVKILGSLGEWSEIQIADGNKAWIQTIHFQQI
ncbi:hypothetical protein AwDysgo_13890 [Bacteroidales bacterium]|nr:hypothetical protein AwDysgo_13890 [Bacteroidales bacterium]